MFSPVAVSLSKKPTTSHQLTATANVSTATSAYSTAAKMQSAPACSPAGTYSLPSTIIPVRPGLQEIIDRPTFYTVYGNTASQVDSQIAVCTPVISSGTNGPAGKYAANTGNAVSWILNYTYDGSGTCTVTSAEVTLHINQTFPKWLPTAGTPAALNSAWQTYINKLYAYEQGHVVLDEKWAKTLLADLQTIPPTPCQSIDNAANSVAQKDLNASLAANTNYDQTNDFGLKENVVL